MIPRPEILREGHGDQLDRSQNQEQAAEGDTVPAMVEPNCDQEPEIDQDLLQSHSPGAILTNPALHSD